MAFNLTPDLPFDPGDNTPEGGGTGTPPVTGGGGETPIPEMPIDPGSTVKYPPNPHPQGARGGRVRIVNPPIAPQVPDIPALPNPDPVIPWAPPDPGPTPPSRTLTIKATSGTFLPIIYGKTRTGGIIVYEKVLSNGDLLVAWWLCHGEINSISNILVDGLPFGNYGMAQGVKWNLYTGTSSQPVDPIGSAADVNWTSSWPGIAYIVARFPAPTSNQPAPDIENFICDIQGLKVRDPRTDPTLVNRYYRETPALALADILTSTRYGLREPDSSIDWTGSFTSAANTQDYLLGGTTPRFKISLLMREKKAPMDWLNIIRLSGQSYLVRNCGIWCTYVDQDQADSGIVLTDQGGAGVANIVDANLRIHSGAETPSKVTVTIVDSENNYVNQPVTDVDPLVQTGAVHLVESTLDISGCPTKDQGVRIARWARKRAQTCDKSAAIFVNQIGARILPWSIVRVTSAQLGWSNQQAIVLDAQFAPGTSGMAWKLDVDIWSNTIFSDSQYSTTVLPPPTVPSPYDTIPEVTGLTLTEVLQVDKGGITEANILAQWTLPNYGFLGGARITAQPPTGTPFIVGTITGTTQQSILIPSVFPGSWTITVQVISTFGSLLSAGASSSITSQGKIVPPADVPLILAQQLAGSVKLSWQPATDPDVRGYEVRRGKTTDTWATASPLPQVGATTSSLVDSPPNSVALPSSVWRYFIKAWDFAKNWSVNAATCDIGIFNAGPALVDTVKAFRPYYMIEFNNTDTYRQGAAVFEGWRVAAFYASTARFFLCRTLSPATSDAEIASNSYASISAWETGTDTPRRGGQGLWAPLDSTITSGSFGAFYGYNGTAYRNQEIRSRIDGLVKVGLDTPDIICKAEPILMTGITGPVVRTGPSGPSGWLIHDIQLSTNNPFSQMMVILPSPYAVFYDTTEEYTIPLATVDAISDGSGNAAYTLPTALQLAASCTLSIGAQILAASGSLGWRVSSVSNTGFSIFIFNTTTGAAVSGITIRVTVTDAGLGGSAGAFVI